MKSVHIDEAKYVHDHVVYLRFSDGLCGQVDLKETVNKYKIAEPLKDPVEFSKFYLDSWPTLAWACGFDIAPESLYQKCTQTVGELT